MCPTSQGGSELIPQAGLKHELMAHAKQAAENAYAPYSGFKVGAAIKVRGGGIFAGCNVENSAYGLTQCAERNAINQAIAAGVRRGDIRNMVIFVPGDVPFTPCGACRQVMHEMMSKDAQVMSLCESEQSYFWPLESLLPDAFDL